MDTHVLKKERATPVSPQILLQDGTTPNSINKQTRQDCTVNTTDCPTNQHSSKVCSANADRRKIQDNQKPKKKSPSHVSIHKTNVPKNGSNIEDSNTHMNNNLDRSNSLDALTDSDPVEHMRGAHIGGTHSRQIRVWSSRRRNTIISNSAQLILGLALIQIGIVITWYMKFVQSDNDNTGYVFFSSGLFFVCGGYGLVIKLQKLRKLRKHRVGFITTGSFSMMASVFISVVSVRLVLIGLAESLVMKIMCGFGVTLSVANIVAVSLAIYYTLYKRRKRRSHSLAKVQTCPVEPTPWYLSLFMIINITHIIIGICICELGMVGLIYRRYMNLRSSGLFSAVFISVTFIATGIFGLYCHCKQRISNSMLWLGSCALISGACSAAILIIIVLTMTGKFYYSGTEAILAFDYMILCLSSLELLSSVASICIIGIPTIKHSSSKSPSQMEQPHQS